MMNKSMPDATDVPWSSSHACPTSNVTYCNVNILGLSGLGNHRCTSKAGALIARFSSVRILHTAALYPTLILRTRVMGSRSVTDLEAQQVTLPRVGTVLPLSYHCPFGKMY